MKNIKKYIPLIIILVIAGLGFVYRENISRAVRGDAYVDNKIFTKQLEKAQKSGKEAFPQLTDKVGKDEAEVILHTSKGGDGTGGESIWKKGFAVEPTPFLYNIRGALAMANTGAKDSNGSQFFIVQNKDDQSKQLGNAGYPKPIIDAYKKGGYPAGDTKYTVFGQVIKGMDVVDTIANLEVDDNNKPKENLTVNSVEVIKDYKFK